MYQVEGPYLCLGQSLECSSHKGRVPCRVFVIFTDLRDSFGATHLIELKQLVTGFSGIRRLQYGSVRTNALRHCENRMQYLKFTAIIIALCTGCGLRPYEQGTPEPSCTGLECPTACTDGPCLDANSLDACGAVPVSCEPIEENPEWELCEQTDSTCVGVFYDAVGCQAFCQSVGLICSEVWENLDGECVPDDSRTPLGCNIPTGHQSDWCVCVDPCECVADCEDRQCGDDGCGGSCGECSEDAQCEFGECVEQEEEEEEEERDESLLLSERVGYGENATGGLGGPTCVVTNLKDSGSGSLRACAESNGKKWIVFDVDGELYLKSRIQVKSDKTIDGRDRKIRIQGSGLNLSGVSNIILVNLIFEDGNGSDDNDAITIRNGSKDVWIHHCSFSDYGDGLVDIKEAATDITVSWSLFSKHDKVMLISASTKDTGDTKIRVTVHHNWFKETRQRHPRLRFGRAHVFNNYFYKWKSYGIGCSYKGQCRSENNIFDAATNKKAIIDQVGTDSKDSQVRSDGEWLLNGAKVTENNRSSVFDPNSAYTYSLDKADASLRSDILNHAGWQ